MLKELIARVRNLSIPSDHWRKLETEAYDKGLAEGRDFGERVAHNRTLALELPKILSRHTQLHIRLIKKPKEFKLQELAKFEEKELERLKMDLQR